MQSQANPVLSWYINLIFKEINLIFKEISKTFGRLDSNFDSIS